MFHAYNNGLHNSTDKVTYTLPDSHILFFLLRGNIAYIYSKLPVIDIGQKRPLTSGRKLRILFVPAPLTNSSWRGLRTYGVVRVVGVTTFGNATTVTNTGKN